MFGSLPKEGHSFLKTIKNQARNKCSQNHEYCKTLIKSQNLHMILQGFKGLRKYLTTSTSNQDDTVHTFEQVVIFYRFLQPLKQRSRRNSIDLYTADYDIKLICDKAASENERNNNKQNNNNNNNQMKMIQRSSSPIRVDDMANRSANSLPKNILLI